MTTRTHDVEFLQAALRGYEAQLQDINQKIGDLRGRITGKKAPAAGGNRHRISAAGRERIRQAQLRRWAATRKSAKKAAAA